MHFYPGLNLDILYSIPSGTYLKLVEAMSKIRARHKLHNMEVADYPKMNKQSRQRVHKRVSKESNTEDGLAKRAVTVDDLGKIYGDFGSIEAVMRDK